MEIFAPKRVKEKAPQGRQPQWTQEFMMMVAKKVIDEKMTYREAGKIFGISHGTVYAWKRMYKKGKWGNADKLTQVSDEHKLIRMETQMRDLKHEIAELYLENQMLKKMVQHSRQIKKENSSVITSENLDQYRKGVK
jgi:transposase-like protein